MTQYTDSHHKKLHASLLRFSEVDPVAVRWLWYPYIPLGKITLLEGDPGLGKTYLSLALAASVSKGYGLPGKTTRSDPGRTIIFTAEDDIADTLRPRMDRTNGTVPDLTLIYAFKDVLTLSTNSGLSDMTYILNFIKPTLVILDPLVAYMGSEVDLNRANETREVMADLKELAEKFSCAIVPIRHLTKGARDQVIYRGIGSIDIIAAARSALLIQQDKREAKKDSGSGTKRVDIPGQIVMIHTKSNVGPKGIPRKYTILKDQFNWLEEE